MSDRPKILVALGEEFDRVARQRLSGGARRADVAARSRPRPSVRVVAGVLSVAVTVAVLVVVVVTAGSPSPHTVAVARPPATITTRTQTDPSRTPSPVKHVNLFALAEANAHDSPLKLFQTPLAIDGGASPANLWRETVIRSTVRKLGSFSLAGVGTVQFWSARTEQDGICEGLRLPDGEWAGLQDDGRGGGSMPGCFPSRATVGAGALIIDGFDDVISDVTGSAGQHWMLIAGRVSIRHSVATVIDTYSHRAAQIVKGNYFAIVVPPVGNDYGDDVHLQALGVGGKVYATQGKPLPGTLTSECVGKRRVVREHVPGSRRTVTMDQCSKFKLVKAK